MPVSLSGVIIAIGLAKWHHHFQWVPALLCLTFALLAQIVSNTANEYFDYLQGTDKPGRVGPRRGRQICFCRRGRRALLQGCGRGA